MLLKSKLFFYCLFFISFYTSSQNTFVPDDNFEQALIDLGYDVGPLDDFVPTTNINTVTSLDLSPFTNQVSDLTGIEGFINLTILNFENHLVTGANLSSNISLEELYCNNNLLNNLNITSNINLEIIWCNNNLLTNLDISNSSNLRALDCSFNQINNLNVDQNIFLVDFVCENNNITNINVNNNAVLRRFECGSNLLSVLDVSSNINLSYFSCEVNQLTSLDLSQNNSLDTLICFENQLSELDLSQNSSLTTLNCTDNNLCFLNIRNGNNNNAIDVDFSSNTNLECVIVDSPNNILASWLPTPFLNYTSSLEGCSAFVNVDNFDDVITFTDYTLPTLTYGSYYTGSDASGLQLNAGDIISDSQTIFIYNETTCFSNESSFNVLVTDEFFIPKYFTPNNDGTNDLWKVYDNTNTLESVSIFNKYGKLLKQLPANSDGWNGVFNGKPLQSTDYWYVINLNTGETIKGHFSLKR